MITRFLYLSLGWLIINLFATIIGGTRLRHGNAVISIGWWLGTLLLGDIWALLTFGILHEIALFTAAAFLFGLLCIRWMRYWNAFGQATWTASIMTTVLFIIYAFQVTAFTPLSPLSFLLALIFFFIEALALIMALTHSYESLDATCRIRWRRLDRFASAGLPAYGLLARASV